MKLYHKKLLLWSSCAVFLLLALLVFYWKMSGSNAHFNLVVLLIAIRYVLLCTSILLIILRQFKLTVKSINYLYLMASLLNVLIGIFSLIFYFFGRANMWWLNQTMLNWLVGLLMVLDIFIFSKSRPFS